MKRYHCLKILSTVLMYTDFCSAEIHLETNLKSVTYFEDLERYYRILRQQIPGMQNPPTEPSDPRNRKRIKRKICKRIFRSHFFRFRGIDWVNIDSNEVREYLRINHQNTFYTIFNEYQYENRISKRTAYGYEYENAYRVTRVKINDDEEGDEYVFTCFGRERSSARIRKYLISRAYNVNLLHIYAIHIAARLIFTPSDSGDSLKIVAMAEESADEFPFARRTKLVSLFYALLRWKTFVVDAPELDPICTLSPEQKLRVCSSIYSLSVFERKIIFDPVLENVQIDDCVRKTVQIAFSRERPFEEWVIGCKALTKTKIRPITFYVSRGAEENSVFVYQNAPHRMLSVYNVCNFLSMVGGLEQDIGGEETEDEVPENETRAVELFLQMNVED